MDIAKFLNQTAVHWRFSGFDGFGGFTFDSSPSEESVRWADETSIYASKDGEEIAAKTKILTKSLVNENDYYYLGELTDLNSGEISDPTTVDGAYRVKRVYTLVDIKGNTLGYKAFFDEGTA
jgi:hypothetical protein